MKHRSSRGSRRRRAEGGVVLLEFAAVAMFLFILAAATIDYGRGWRGGLGVNEAVRTGARTGSAAGPDRSADFTALAGVKASLDASGLLAGVERVVVFRADSDDGKVPASCKTGGGSVCQVIAGTAFQTPWEQGSYESATNTAGCLNVATTRNWCPTSRNNIQISSEYYGVWVRVRMDYLFPILGSDLAIERTAVMRLEPLQESP